MSIVLATRNANKLREFRQLLAGCGAEIISLEHFPGCPDVVEDGTSFAENALKKACSVADYTGRVAVADDSGLEVDALGGMPGIYSARYAGQPADDRKNIARLLKTLAGLPAQQRGAQFRCVIALAGPDGRRQVVEGSCRGIITEAPRGSSGFGYDPVFYDAASGLTFAEMAPEHKNRISHRARAIAELQKILPDFLKEIKNKIP